MVVCVKISFDLCIQLNKVQYYLIDNEEEIRWSNMIGSYIYQFFFFLGLRLLTVPVVSKWSPI